MDIKAVGRKDEEKGERELGALKNEGRNGKLQRTERNVLRETSA